MNDGHTNESSSSLVKVKNYKYCGKIQKNQTHSCEKHKGLTLAKNGWKQIEALNAESMMAIITQKTHSETIDF